jgi:hypothetical protein
VNRENGLSELKQVLASIPEAAASEEQAWTLEILDARGNPIQRYNIKTGQRLRVPEPDRQRHRRQKKTKTKEVSP